MPGKANIYADSHEALVVGLARAGDRQAFAELVRRRQSWIRNLMRRLCGQATLADDLSQQVFLQAWMKIRHLRQPHTFGAWLKQVAINTCLQHLRRNDALRDASEFSEIDAQGTPAAGLAMDLDRALATLPGPVRLCIVLAYHECLTQAEIASMTRIPLGTVKSHIRRGSARLQTLLADYRLEPVQEATP